MAETSPVTLTIDPPPRGVPRPQGNIARWMERQWGWSEGSLMGATDVAAHLGVTRQRISQLKRDDPTFPPSGVGAYGARLWRRTGIQAWAAMHRPNRPEAGGRFVGDAADLLLAAEQVAAERKMWWVEAGHVWAAVAAGAAGSPLAEVLARTGFTSEAVDQYLQAMRGTRTRGPTTLGMTPRLQTFLSKADRRAAKADRDRVSTIDVLMAFVDAPRMTHPRLRRARPEDNTLDALERRGLDIDELRRRLLAVEVDPDAALTFEERQLKKPRKRTARPVLPGVDLAPNGLGHEPRTRVPWGSSFGRTRDERSLIINGERWFFMFDGDGFYVRTADGRPVGYRWRLRPKRVRKRPVNGMVEVLPMPPVELDGWPDRRVGQDDHKTS